MPASRRGLDRRVAHHPTRRRLIEALWHSSEPLSARSFHRDYTNGELSLTTIGRQLGELERADVVEPVRR